jgi:4a-hydroxytetrahydrobiopterin dehydratase
MNETMIKEDIEKQLKQAEGWKLVDSAIEKNYRFGNFRQATAFINKFADAAEAENHHPDILLWNWSNVKLTLTAHTVKGVSMKDFVVASRIDQIEL